MKEFYHFFAKKAGTALLLCFFIIFHGGCVYHGKFLGEKGGLPPPRIRIASYASTSLGTSFIDPELLRTHQYRGGWSERNGIVYTCKAGHIDIAHLRKAADYTAFLAEKTSTQLKKNKTGFSFKFTEPSLYVVQLDYPDYFKYLPQADRELIARDISIRLGEHFAYVGTTWHEILTWFGYKSTGFLPEFPSAFSWEDGFSNLLGTHIAARALRDTQHSYDQAMTLALEKELQKLDVQPRDTAILAAEKVKGEWYTGGFLFFVDMKKRNFDIGLDDGYVTPWIVPSLTECEGAEPQPYPVPNLDFLAKYGFTMTLEIEPKELESGKILSIVYPDRQERKNRIEPAVHFAQIMDHIKQDAVKRYGYDIGPSRKVSQVRAQLGAQQGH